MESRRSVWTGALTVVMRTGELVTVKACSECSTHILYLQSTTLRQLYPQRTATGIRYETGGVEYEATNWKTADVLICRTPINMEQQWNSDVHTGSQSPGTWPLSWRPICAATRPGESPHSCPRSVGKPLAGCWVRIPTRAPSVLTLIVSGFPQCLVTTSIRPQPLPCLSTIHSLITPSLDARQTVPQRGTTNLTSCETVSFSRSLLCGIGWHS
jgi:hypothetical protein